jgi:glycosyltransferase involved in cell wall biosynthesis
MKIAVASSGLGHVARGIETWAHDTASALVARGVDATLFCGKALAAGGATLPVVPLACLRRDEKPARWLARLAPGAAWRWGLKSTYGWEQFSFWLSLWPKLVRGRYDVLHVQDPMLAWWCRMFRKKGWVKTREILAHGTEEPADFLAPFDYVQHLAPWHFEQNQAVGRPYWTAIPNFVDVGTFAPAPDGRAVGAARRKFGIPEDAFVIGTSAAVKRTHKRIDFLIGAFADLPAHGLVHGRKPYLLIAGARHADTAALQKMADDMAPGRVKIMTNVPRADMPDVYRAMDICVLCSLFEMMPISILEALACGVPMLVNRHPVLEWMVGPGGACVDMTRRTVLADFLAGMPAEWPPAKGRMARQHAVDVFSKDAVIGQYIEYYRRVLNPSAGATVPHG